MNFGQFFWQMEKMIADEYEITSTIRHRGERGRDREHGLAAFLKENLPEVFGVATGELFAAETEDISPQCDIILYDRLYMPIIGRSRAVQRVPIEAAYAVIEVKSILDASGLRDAFAKFEKIRRVPRLTRGGLLFVVFGYKFQTSAELCIKYVRDAFDSDANTHNDYLVTALDKGSTVAIAEDDLQKPERVVFLTTSGQGATGRNIHYTLAFLFANLLESLGDNKPPDVSYKDLINPFGHIDK